LGDRGGKKFGAERFRKEQQDKNRLTEGGDKRVIQNKKKKNKKDGDFYILADPGEEIWKYF